MSEPHQNPLERFVARTFARRRRLDLAVLVAVCAASTAAAANMNHEPASTPLAVPTHRIVHHPPLAVKATDFDAIAGTLPDGVSLTRCSLSTDVVIEGRAFTRSQIEQFRQGLRDLSVLRQVELRWTAQEGGEAYQRFCITAQSASAASASADSASAASVSATAEDV